MPHLPYLAELKEVLTDPAVRKGYTLRILRLKGWSVVPYRFGSASGLLTHKDLRGGETSVANCVFGCLNQVSGAWTMEELKFGDPYRPQLVSDWGGRRWDAEWMAGRRVVLRAVCGVEIVGMRPKATKSTHSNSCWVTLKELKMACKENGIKGISKMSKIEMMSALMKA